MNKPAIGDAVVWRGLTCKVLRFLPADRVENYLVLRLPNGAETRASPGDLARPKVGPGAMPKARAAKPTKKWHWR